MMVRPSQLITVAAHPIASSAAPSATPELDTISVTGFRSIKAISALPLRPINLLIGANGAGKSNFIGVFAFLHALREGRLQDYVRKAGGAEQLLHFGSKRTRDIHIGVSFQNKTNSYCLHLRPSDDDSLYVSGETAYFWDKARYPRPMDVPLPTRDAGKEAGISESGLKRTASWVQTRLGHWRIYHVHDTSSSSPLRKSAQINDNAFLRSDGSNLPAFLYLLQQRHPDAYGQVREVVRRVAPFFDDFLLAPDQLNPDTIRLAWRHRESDQYFGAATFSDGSLRFLTLATLFLQPRQFRPSVILVDEPELGLHPFAINLLASLVKQVSVETQVIVRRSRRYCWTTLSPKMSWWRNALTVRHNSDGLRLSL
jgi:predicted ATPase